MLNKESADEIIRLLLLNQKTSSELIDWAEECRQRGNWDGIIAYWDSQFKKASRPLDGSDYIEGVGQMYMGAAYYGFGDWEKALQHYRCAEQMFSFENDWYSKGLVHMAQGLVYRAKGDLERARIVCQQSQQVFSGLVNKFEKLRKMRKANQCAGLWGRLQGMIEGLASSHRGRGPVHLIPHVGVTAAGEPVYIVDENIASGTLADEVFVASTQYRLLSLKSRVLTYFRFNPFDTYFTLDVRGDSMVNAGIHPDDRILVRKQQDVEPSEIAVVLINDPRGPPTSLVKKVRREGDYIYLDSENPAYMSRVFASDSSAIQILGKVMAILERIEE